MRRGVSSVDSDASGLAPPGERRADREGQQQAEAQMELGCAPECQV
jgi:hypothetical protein